MPKEYIAKAKLGILTSTLDITGEVERECRVPPVTKLREVLRGFEGEIEQIPPPFSALSRRGVRLYKLARIGVKIRLKARRVRIQKIELLDLNPPFFTIKALVSKGTYIRSLIRDIGERLGSCATLVELKRTKVGGFRIEDSIPLSSLQKENLCSHLLTIDEALLGFPRVVVEDPKEVLKGRPLRVEGIEGKGIFRIVDKKGKTLIMGRKKGEMVFPVRVIYADS